ncbi:MAG: DUF1664 domain-containing protein [bacterium]|nr:DUF1664 domain-containing protein [bacterium]
MEKPATDEKVTRKDLLDLEERLIGKLSSKEELDQKIAKLATKEELKQEVAKLATREALEVVANQVMKNTNDIENIKTELQAINHKIDRLEEKFDYKFNMVLDAVDNVLKEVTNNRTEKVGYGHTMNRHEGRIENHEKRIKKLEQRAI